MVRWLGAKRVTYFVEKLISIARAADPRPLYSYASYPPTEYLLPQNVDFYTFNVYLERRTDFEKYLARLQNLAEDKPLILGRIRPRHDPEQRGAPGGDSRLASRMRGQGRGCRDDFLFVDGRMVSRR